MEKIRYEPDGSPIVGPALRVRADVFPGAVHLHVENAQGIFVGMVTCHWNDNVEDARAMMLTTLDRVFAQMAANTEPGQGPAANG